MAPPDSSAAVVDAPRAGDPTLPPIPEGAVMVTLRLARFNPEYRSNTPIRAAGKKC